jgi:virulence-associated protein VapD
MRTSPGIEVVLTILQQGAETAADILDAMLSNYASSRRKLSRSLRYGPRRFKTDWAAAYRDRQKFFKLMDHLKRQGLIEPKQQGSQRRWRLTAAGRAKLPILRERNLYAREQARYENTGPDINVKIITYDIPVKEGQRKRDWLRAVLQNLGFTMLQKSVWVGKRKVPEAFFEDLRARHMLDFVQVFAVAKSGTLRELL